MQMAFIKKYLISGFQWMEAGEMDCILYAYSVEFQRFNNLNVKHEHMATLDANCYRDVWEEGDGGNRRTFVRQD